ncbi:Methionyl-tRNA formyltransferase [Coemansia brasiliensis]|uniref:methionyl-tRNA formyltransferase n=1 Tax=Coemansia brasiliensis TaxID=2650707 RepID=A0A9W8ID58_9FUNG|nr:Methionyl-tRNA formyltransferase [Coemansia brasiliensis]
MSTLRVIARPVNFATRWLLAYGIGRRAISTSSIREKYKVLFFGTDEFARGVLKELYLDSQTTSPVISHLELVCPPHQFVSHGKKTKLKWKADTSRLSSKYGIKTHFIPTADEGKMIRWELPMATMKGGSEPFDIGIVASFGAFLPQRIIDELPLKMLNVHPSMLPKYRGPSPIETAILNNDKSTGISIQEVHPTKFDAGKVLAQRPYDIKTGITRKQMGQEMGTEGGKLLLQVLRDLDRMRANAWEQDETQVTKTRRFGNLDARINWKTMTAHDIMRIYCAHYERYVPWSHLRVKNSLKMVKFLVMGLPEGQRHMPVRRDFLDLVPGTMSHQRKTNFVEFNCIDGGRILVTRFIVEGKQPCDGLQFNAGYIKKFKSERMLSESVNMNMPTPPFEYPEGYSRPTLEKALHMFDTPLEVKIPGFSPTPLRYSMKDELAKEQEELKKQEQAKKAKK